MSARAHLWPSQWAARPAPGVIEPDALLWGEGAGQGVGRSSPAAHEARHLVDRRGEGRQRGGYCLLLRVVSSVAEQRLAEQVVACGTELSQAEAEAAAGCVAAVDGCLVLPGVHVPLGEVGQHCEVVCGEKKDRPIPPA
jgi:hypothetical protein